MGIQSGCGLRKKIVKIVLYVALIILAVFALFPFYWALASSFRSDEEIFKYASPLTIHTLVPINFSLDSYSYLFNEMGFGGPVEHTLIVVFSCIFFGLIINGLAGFAFAKFNFKGKKLLFGIVIVSFMVNFDSIAIPLYSLVNSFGWIDSYKALIIPTVADGMVLFLFKQFFEEIPDSILESARIDGANWLTVFWKIVVPISVPVFITAGLVIFVTQWSSFMWPLLAARTPSHKLIQVAMADFHTEFGVMWSRLFAATVITALIPVTLFLPFQKYYVAGITSGSVKG